MTNPTRLERRIKKDFQRLSQMLTRLERHVATLRWHAQEALHEVEIIMPGIDELNTAIADLKSKVEADEASDAALVVQLDAQIADLEAQLAAGTPVDTQAQIDALQSIADALQPAQ